MSDAATQPISVQTGAATDPATAAPAPSATAEAAPAASEGSGTPPPPPPPPAAAAPEEMTAAKIAGAKARTLFGTLDAGERIRAGEKQNERMLWAGAIGVTLVYAGLIATQALQLSATDLAEMERRKRGQDAPNSISVELVPDPDKTSRTQHWQEGANAPAENPEQQPPQVASLPEPEVEAKTQEKAEEQPKPDKPTADEEKTIAPTLPDINTLVDAAAADLDRKIKEHLEQKELRKKRQREQAAIDPGGGLKVRGTGASGRSDAFSRSVIAALMKTRPGPFALIGRVLVSFEITEAGKVKYVHLLQSSGNSALDAAAIGAIRRAEFEPPPPGLSTQDRTYIIDYIFG